ncbi:MAG: Chromate transport protein [Herbinix sp.]|jgi:chromate transporter|nr:Chromate transport protein [Herbinix sp.]
MEKNVKLYWKLFLSTFSLSAFTFGGGFVIVPLMKKRFVDKLKWIEEEEMLNLVAISQSSPGPIAVNASILVGYRMAGISGAIVSTLGTVLPPLIILTTISFFYEAFRSSAIISALLKGMQAGIAAVIVDVIISLAGGIVKEKHIISIIMMAFAFVATYFLNVNVAYIVLVSGMIGALTSIYRGKKEKRGIKP